MISSLFRRRYNDDTFLMFRVLNHIIIISCVAMYVISHPPVYRIKRMKPSLLLNYEDLRTHRGGNMMKSNDEIIPLSFRL